MKTIPFKIVENPGGSYAIIENPDSDIHGHTPIHGDAVIRSPFDTAEEARQRCKDIAEHDGYEVTEID